MTLPVRPPLAPMLARLSRELPRSPGLVYEPKWDGFRCLAFVDGAEVDLRSRSDRLLARYFPEIVAALRGRSGLFDGELLASSGAGYDFEALLLRLHPTASRARQLAGQTPATFVAFDLLATDHADLRGLPFAERRDALVHRLADAPPAALVTPATRDAIRAERWLHGYPGGGADGVVAKPDDLVYQPGARAMIKVKPVHTVDCVVAGFRALADRRLVSSLLLGLYDDAGELHSVGVASQFRAAQRAALLAVLRPHVVPLAGHPWERGFGLQGGALGRLKGTAGRWTPELTLDWVPVRPSLVCEVSYDAQAGGRFRHPARFRRWRPDREPLSCRLNQLAPAA